MSIEGTNAEVSTSDALQAIGGALDEVQTGAELETAPVTKTEPETDSEAEKKVETKPEVEKLAGKFAALSRKEKEIRTKEKALMARQKELEAQYGAKETEIKAKYVDPEAFKADPLGALEKLGVSFKDIAEMVLNDGKPTAEHKATELERRLTAKIEALEKAQKDKEESKAKQDFEQQLAGFKNGLVEFVQADQDGYEMINAEEQYDLVYEVIETHYNKTADEDGANGQVLSYKVAADAVENHLLEKAKSLVTRKKVKATLPALETAKKVPETAAKTLSNAHSTGASQTTSKIISDEESKSLAAKLIRWND